MYISLLSHLLYISLNATQLGTIYIYIKMKYAVREVAETRFFFLLSSKHTVFESHGTKLIVRSNPASLVLNKYTHRTWSFGNKYLLTYVVPHRVRHSNEPAKLKLRGENWSYGEIESNFSIELVGASRWSHFVNREKKRCRGVSSSRSYYFNSGRKAREPSSCFARIHAQISFARGVG